TFLGSDTITTDGSGAATFSFTYSAVVGVGDVITATATDPAGNTSEFSAALAARAPEADLALTKTDNIDPAANGGGFIYYLTVDNNGPDTATGVTLTDTLPASVTFQSAVPSQGSCSGTTTVTCNLGAILNGSNATVEILVVTSGTGTITNTADVTANEIDPVAADNSVSEDTDVVDENIVDIPLIRYQRLHGFIDYTVTGGTLRTGSNSSGPCNLAPNSTENLAGIPGGATVSAAYLYWAGSGNVVDDQVTLDGTPLTADRTFTGRFSRGANDYDFFSGFKDVTAQVAAKGNGSYTFADLTVASTGRYCSSQAVLAGWSLFVIYQEASLPPK
ncbi:MAG: DUF11 domain-containing protein, partial [bacterium]|nr:DUF11 domain-containing protein [bacterium]